MNHIYMYISTVKNKTKHAPNTKMLLVKVNIL